MNAKFPVRITAVDHVALDVVRIELRHPEGERLPAFSAGAHIDLHLAPGLVRSYSLLNHPAEAHRYVIAVHRAPGSRGGSSYVHDTLRTGMEIEITAPRNHFGLDETAEHSVFIAGGIGITPLYAMLQRMEGLGRSWQLYYCARTADHAALRREISAYGERVRFNFDQEPGGRLLDLHAVVSGVPDGSHFYCCGPVPMLSAFEAATAGLPPEQVHLEYFQAREPAGGVAAHGYTVRLARTGDEFTVGADESILDKLIERDFNITYSCREGVCGACETIVLEGAPDHRDQVLSQAERAAGRSMMVCCSGALGEHLVLDL